MKFPDKFRIVDSKAGNHKNANESNPRKFNSNFFNNVRIINSNDMPATYLTEIGLALSPYTLKTGIESTQEATKYYNYIMGNILLNPEKNEIANFNNDRIYYPNKSYGVDMVRVSGTNNYYVRLKTRTTINANNDYQEEAILYPIKLADIPKYKFTTEFLVSIPNTDGAQIGPAF